MGWAWLYLRIKGTHVNTLDGTEHSFDCSRFAGPSFSRGLRDGQVHLQQTFEECMRKHNVPIDDDSATFKDGYVKMSGFHHTKYARLSTQQSSRDSQTIAWLKQQQHEAIQLWSDDDNGGNL